MLTGRSLSGRLPKSVGCRERDVTEIFRARDVGDVSFTARTVAAQLTCRQVNSRWTSGGDH